MILSFDFLMDNSTIIRNNLIVKENYLTLVSVNQINKPLGEGGILNMKKAAITDGSRICIIYRVNFEVGTPQGCSSLRVLVETRGIEPLSGTESSGTSPGAVSD